MKLKKIISVFLAISYSICQLIPYESPISFHKQIDIFKDSAESLNKNENNFTCDNYSVCQKNINFDFEKNIYFSIKVINSNKNDKFYIIDNDNNSYQGPYHLDKEYILTNPVKSKNITLEINKVSDLTEIELTIKEFENEKIDNTINYFKNDSRDNPVILITGFWPPTNEMIRHFSQDILLNPNGWAGENWENSGYDIISYFPEFSDPDCLSCGQGYGDFEVDYQDTSEDFWPIVNSHDPLAIITFSRGYMDQSWELEFNYYNRTNWYNDYTSPFQPTPNPPDQDQVPFFIRNSNLPMNDIMDAINNLDIGLNSYIDINGDPGSFVSEFMGFHGVWYRDINQFEDNNCIAAGHVHVGGYIPTETAKLATEQTIRELIYYLDDFNYTSGDVNEDEIIDVLDLVLIINNILNIVEFNNIQTLAADVNEDEIINIQDIIIVINMILN